MRVLHCAFLHQCNSWVICNLLMSLIQPIITRESPKICNCRMYVWTTYFNRPQRVMSSTLWLVLFPHPSFKRKKMKAWIIQGYTSPTYTIVWNTVEKGPNPGFVDDQIKHISLMACLWCNLIFHKMTDSFGWDLEERLWYVFKNNGVYGLPSVPNRK